MAAKAQILEHGEAKRKTFAVYETLVDEYLALAKRRCPERYQLAKNRVQECCDAFCAQDALEVQIFGTIPGPDPQWK